MVTVAGLHVMGRRLRVLKDDNTALILVIQLNQFANMKKLILIVVLVGSSAIAAICSCSATLPCGGGVSVECSGDCNCNVISGGVSCGGAQTCCPQR